MLLSRDDFVSAVNEEGPKPELNQNLPQPETKTQVKPPTIEIEEPKRPKSSENETHDDSVLLIKKDADKALKEHLNTSSSTSLKVYESLKNQEGINLEKRLKARKRATSPNQIPEGRCRAQTVEVSMKASAELKFERYQEEIERTMEKFVEEKANRIVSIKNKYKEEINEVNMMGNNGNFLNRHHCASIKRD